MEITKQGIKRQNSVTLAVKSIKIDSIYFIQYRKFHLCRCKLKPDAKVKLVLFTFRFWIGEGVGTGKPLIKSDSGRYFPPYHLSSNLLDFITVDGCKGKLSTLM